MKPQERVEYLERKLRKKQYEKVYGKTMEYYKLFPEEKRRLGGYNIYV